jgi:hypothetical protein
MTRSDDIILLSDLPTDQCPAFSLSIDEGKKSFLCAATLTAFIPKVSCKNC